MSLSEVNIIKVSKLNCEDTTELNATWLWSALKRDWLADKPMQEAIIKGKTEWKRFFRAERRKRKLPRDHRNDMQRAQRIRPLHMILMTPLIHRTSTFFKHVLVLNVLYHLPLVHESSVYIIHKTFRLIHHWLDVPLNLIGNVKFIKCKHMFEVTSNCLT